MPVSHSSSCSALVFDFIILIALPVGSKLKAPELRKLVEQDEELLNMSDEKLRIAKRGVDEKRMLSTRGARPNVASAAKDYSATSQRMQNEVSLC